MLKQLIGKKNCSMTRHFRFLLAAAFFLGGSTQSFAKDDQWNGPGRAAIKAFVKKRGGLVEDVSFPIAFYGDFNGDGNEDAVVFIYSPIPGAASGVDLKVALFKGQGGKYKFMRYVPNIYGQEPRNVVFSDGKVEVTTSILGDNDAHCCPSHPKKYTIKTK